CSLLPPPPPSTLFPYTTLFRSLLARCRRGSRPGDGGRPRTEGRRRRREGPGGAAMAHARRATHRGSHGRTPRNALPPRARTRARSEEHTSELQSRENLVCRLLL